MPENTNGSTYSSTAVSRTTPVPKSLDAALRRVLGRAPRSGDTTAFAAALDRSFTTRERDSRKEIVWEPGGVIDVAGARAVIDLRLAKRIKDVRDHALPLLARLQPQQACVDADEAEATRSIVKTVLDELISELERDGEPRRARVDDLEQRLDKALDALDNAFQITSGPIVTLEDEQNREHFTSLRDDYVKSLIERWKEVGGRTAFSMQLADLSRTLAHIKELVPELEDALDAECYGSTRRLITPVNIGSGLPQISGPAGGRLSSSPPMTINDLLSWLNSFVTHEAPELIRDGQRHGVETMVSTLGLLHGGLRNLSAGLTITDPASCVTPLLATIIDQLKLAEGLSSNIITTWPTGGSQPLGGSTGVVTGPGSGPRAPSGQTDMRVQRRTGGWAWLVELIAYGLSIGFLKGIMQPRAGFRRFRGQQQAWLAGIKRLARRLIPGWLRRLLGWP
jgi:hypothetical protein